MNSMASFTQQKPHRLTPSEGQCDRELVLALDGGGMRGYSSLLIIEALMNQVAEAERGHNMALDDDTLTSLLAYEQEPLLAHYFDYTVGTSTGGLIAIMLGRLRMKVADCLTEYEMFGDRVFGKKRFLRWNQYNHAVLERVVKGVIERYSRETPEHALFTQPESERRSCRTAVMAVRRNPAAGDEAYIFRSYSFTGALMEDQPLDDTRPLNPEGNGLAYIWQAARATSAAPHFFDDIDINGNRFMDGAVQINNPSFRAWTEACAMHHGKELPKPPFDQRRPAIGVFVSIGTGKAAPLTMFGGRNLVRQLALIGKAAIKRLSDPEQTHLFMKSMFFEHDVPYFRFNVPVGLEDIRLDDSSAESIQKITRATKEYLNKTETKQELRLCAEHLVACRRGRNPTEQERRLRELHSNLYDSIDYDTDVSGSTARAEHITFQLSTPGGSGERSRSSSNPGERLSIGGPFVDGNGRLGLCPATSRERGMTQQVVRFRKRSSTS